MTPDVNILIAASRSDHPHHAPALRWLQQALSGTETLVILPMVAAGFLRLVTHPKIFKKPTPARHALEFMQALLAQPGVRMTAVGDEWSILADLCSARKLVGNAVPDAWIAAAVKDQMEHLVTFDKDFRRLLKASELTILPTT